MVAQGAAAPPGAEGGGGGAPTGPIGVWADKQTNAIVVNAPPKTMRSLMAIVDKLDIRREQVLVEAIIVEVLEDRSADLGTTWAIEGSGDNAPIAITNFPAFGPGVVQLAGAIAGGGGTNGGTTTNPTSLIGEGVTIGVGRITDDGVSFAAILRALQGDANTNIISTPTILTTDNEEASLNIGQEVPFVTGQYTDSGGVGSVNPFTTVNRESVGVKLTITPQINEGGDSLLLDISQEISSIASSSAGAVDLITNQRIVETTVIVDDGDDHRARRADRGRTARIRPESAGPRQHPDRRQPFPHAQHRQGEDQPADLHPPADPSGQPEGLVRHEREVQHIRDLQLGRQGQSVPLMPGAERPMLAPLDEQTGQPLPPDAVEQEE